MACLEMYNSDHKGAPPPPMSPRISFSNDFAESHSMKKQERAHLHHTPTNNISSTDHFEFSVSNNNSLHQMTADELFFKGRILPLKDNHHPFHRAPPTTTTTTLRDELLAGEDDEGDDQGNGFSLKPPQSNNKGRWKGFLGLRKSHIGSRKNDSTPLRSFNDPTNTFFSFPIQDHPTLTRSPQGILREVEGTGGDADMEVKL